MLRPLRAYCTHREAGAAVQERSVAITSSPRPSPNGETLLKTATVLRLCSMYRNMSDVLSGFSLCSNTNPLISTTAPCPYCGKAVFFAVIWQKNTLSLLGRLVVSLRRAGNAHALRLLLLLKTRLKSSIKLTARTACRVRAIIFMNVVKKEKSI